jgi:trk system potassium uptake protein TrkA
MRIAFVGASDQAVKTAELLIGMDHEVIIIEKDEARIDVVSELIDASFLHGDGSSPALLQEAGPELTDVLFCLTTSDQANIIAGLVGRSLGFSRVILRITDPDYEPVCEELGLTDLIIPSSTIARYLADMVQGVDVVELSTVIKGNARFFTFVVDESAGMKIGELELPEDARIICFYRERSFNLAESDDSLEEGDEVVVLTTSESLPELRERFEPKTAEEAESDEVEEAAEEADNLESREDSSDEGDR